MEVLLKQVVFAEYHLLLGDFRERPVGLHEGIKFFLNVYIVETHEAKYLCLLVVIYTLWCDTCCRQNTVIERFGCVN